jgi:hypothetical protein
MVAVGSGLTVAVGTGFGLTVAAGEDFGLTVGVGVGLGFSSVGAGVLARNGVEAASCAYTNAVAVKSAVTKTSERM